MVVNQDPKSADVIIVLSSGSDRVEHGVMLYKSGYSDKIILTGGSSETKRMSLQAQDLGVSADDILIEDKSLTTFDNARYSLGIMKAQGFKSAIVVTSPYHTRRSEIIFSHFFRGLDFTMCSIPYDTSIYSNWWKYSQTKKEVISEYLKLLFYYLFQVWFK